MKKQLLAMMALCMTGLWVVRVWAQPAAGPREGRRGDRGARRERRERPGRGAAIIKTLIEELKLTEKQRPPVRQILETHQQEMTTWMQHNGPTMRELMGQLRGGRGRRGEQGAEAPKPPTDAEKKEITDKLRAFQKQRVEKTENLLKQLKDHLTEEQMVTAKRVLARGNRGRGRRLSPAMLRGLELTAEQQKKVDEIMAAARQAAKDKDGAARREAYTEAMEKIVKDVLTAEQREKLEKLQQRRREAGGRRRGTRNANPPPPEGARNAG